MIVEPGFYDWDHVWRDANPETLRMVRDVVDVDDEPSAYDVANASPAGAARCVVPDQRRDGIAAQVYALWSRDSGGIGDLEDVADLARASGAQLLLLSPLHAPLPGLPQQASPYFPSSRQYRNPLHLRVSGVPATNDPSEIIGRDKVWETKLAALMRQWEGFGGDPRFDAYVAREGDDLVRYATFCALSDFFGRPWSSWPSELLHPAGVGVRAFAVERAERVRFHQWLQWRIDEQLGEAANAGAGLIHDVAVGVDPAGADAWMWQDLFAPGFHIGAPPDEFNQAGQDWGLPPMVPAKLRAAQYRPIQAALAAAARHGAGFRIDHVMGLFRLYWVPDGGSPADGVYVRYPAREMLDMVAGVSQRSGAFAVGEDLGTVEPGVREALAARGILSYKVLWFEDDAPGDWPELSLASVTTHDLPTIAGVWGGTDADPAIRERLERVVGADDLSTDEVIARVHARLGTAASRAVVVTAEDLIGVTERPNQPGTTERWNWSRRLPVPVEDVAAAYRRLHRAARATPR
ncbi:MAG: 4-alpha-glucanotransferase [Actinomycetota bacterium]|jgi:4-alpha-glucanotransferase